MASLLLFKALMMGRLAFIFAVLFICVLAQAGPQDDVTFRGWADQIPASLEARGILKVGALDVLKLRKSIAHEHVVVLDPAKDGVIVVGSGTAERMGGMNIPSQHTAIVLVDELKSTLPEIIPVFALHESLDIAGYDDENYQLSMALSSLAKQQSTDTSLFDGLVRLKHDRVYELASGGGATGVGGGGDTMCMFIKWVVLQALREICEKSRPGDDAFMLRTIAVFNRIEIEPNLHLGDGLVDTWIGETPVVSSFYRINSPLSVSVERTEFTLLTPEQRGVVIGYMIRDLMKLHQEVLK